jgi:hypothetical protein
VWSYVLYNIYTEQYCTFIRKPELGRNQNILLYKIITAGKAWRWRILRGKKPLEKIVVDDCPSSYLLLNERTPNMLFYGLQDGYEQCSGIRCLFDFWIQDGWKTKIRIRDEYFS